jgi:heme exporter protein A
MKMQLIAENLGARRGESLLFQDLSFALSAGELLMVTGANGSGKSTLLRVLAGLLSAEQGTVRITGQEGETGHPWEACHYLGHRNAMKRELTVTENLGFWQSFMGDDLSADKRNKGMSVEEATAQVGLAGIAHLPFGYLSAGQQRRMAIAKLLVARRPIWLLDEPTAALDVDADQMFARLARNHLDSGGMIVAATHQPLGVEGYQQLKMTGFVEEVEW